MNIGMILDNEFTGDMRVENEVISLREAGFKVFVLCFNYGEKDSLEEFHGAKIIRMRINPFLKNKMKGLTNTAFEFYSWYWARQIIRFVKKESIDVLHVHDLYLLGGAFKAAKKFDFKLPIVADLHENYPEALKHYKFSNTFPGNILISIPKWERTEIEWVNKSDYVITVIEEAVERYVKLGVNPDKLSVVANYVNRTEFNEQDLDHSMAKRYEEKFTFLYIGGFDTHRGLECVIKALTIVKENIPNFKLVLVGTGKNEVDLRNLAHSLGLDEFIDFEGWQPPSMLPSYIQNSNVCLIPHVKTAHTDNTIPHKLFQYMWLKKPVISTNCKPLERIIKKTNAGLIYNSNSEIEFAKSVQYIHDHPQEAKQMGENGIKAVNEVYNWAETAKNLIDLYEKIENSEKNRKNERV